MLRTLRTWFALLCIVLLAAGYAASQWAYPEGAADHARFMDRPAVANASLILFLVALILAFLPADDAPGEGGS